MSEERSYRGCLKGCAFGCLGFVILALASSGFVLMLQMRGSNIASEDVSDTVRQELPTQPQHRAALTTTSQLSDATGEQALSVDQSLSNEPPTPLALPTDGVGTLQIDFAMGELVIVPSDSSQIEVEADYDKARFRLVEQFEEGRDGEWTYSVSFEPKRRFLGFTKTENRVEIRIPRNHPMRLQGEIKMGASELELGGLWLTAVDLEMKMGDHDISFSEPTRSAIEYFGIRSGMGELQVHQLGNASPARVEVSQRMGELGLDLEGRWLNDSDVTARCRMGECSVHTAEGVRYISKGAKLMMGGSSGRLPDTSELGPDAPTIRLDLGATMGSVSIR